MKFLFLFAVMLWTLPAFAQYDSPQRQYQQRIQMDELRRQLEEQQRDLDALRNEQRRQEIERELQSKEQKRRDRLEDWRRRMNEPWPQ
jgi:hypothetical protein